MTGERDLGSGHDGVNRRQVLQEMAVAGGVAGGVGATGTVHAQPDWEEILRKLTGDCVVDDWPVATENRLNLALDDPEEEGEFPQDGNLALYVHGFGGEDAAAGFNGARQARALELAFREEQVEIPVVAGMWGSLVPPIEPELTGKRLATWLAANANNYDSLFVFGHSLGGLVTVEALAELESQESDARITSAGLLAAAVPPEAVCTEYKVGIETIVEGGVYNYHSEQDIVVCDFADPGVGTQGTGCSGAACTGLPENYVDIDLTPRVGGHCNLFKPESMRYDGESAVPDIVDEQLAEELGLARGTVTGTVTIEDTGEHPESVPDELLIAFVDTDESIVRRALTAEQAFHVTLPEGSYTVRDDDPILTGESKSLTVAADTTTELSLTVRALPAVAENPPQDLNRDGRYRDVNGDGEFTIADVQALFENLDSDAVQDSAAFYNFSDANETRVTVFDVQALFTELSNKE